MVGKAVRARVQLMMDPHAKADNAGEGAHSIRLPMSLVSASLRELIVDVRATTPSVES